jgi:hypothetical protein
MYVVVIVDLIFVHNYRRYQLISVVDELQTIWKDVLLMNDDDLEDHKYQIFVLMKRIFLKMRMRLFNAQKL